MASTQKIKKKMNSKIIEDRLQVFFRKLSTIEKQLEDHNLQNKEILTFKEACLFLAISDSKLYKMTSSGLIPFFKPDGGKLYFKRTDLEDYCLQKPSLSSTEMSKQARAWLDNNLNVA